MTMAWVLGWAVPEAWFAPLAREVFPRAQHTFFPAAPDATTRLIAAGPFAWTAGYSLGAQLLLAAAARGAAFGRVALLAPIFAFPLEEKLGGRIARTQVRHLARWVRRDAPAALADFYQRAALDVPAEFAPCDESENLTWGLERLAHDRVEPPLPVGWRAWCGRDDPLLDADQLAALVLQTRIVPQATHHPRELLRAMAEEIT